MHQRLVGEFGRDLEDAEVEQVHRAGDVLALAYTCAPNFKQADRLDALPERGRNVSAEIVTSDAVDSPIRLTRTPRIGSHHVDGCTPRNEDSMKGFLAASLFSLYFYVGYAAAESYQEAQRVAKPQVADDDSDIDPYSGSLRQVIKELEINGNGGLSLIVHRIYDSETVGSEAYGRQSQGLSHDDWPYGRGWRLAAMPRIQIASIPARSMQEFCQLRSQGRRQLLELPNGTSEMLYADNVSGSGTASYSASGWKLTCVNSVARLWSPDGLVYEMPHISEGPLGKLRGEVEIDSIQYVLPSKVTDPNGNWITVNYASYWALQSHRFPLLVPTAITSIDGRQIQFSYNVVNISGRSHPVLTQMIGAEGRIWRYRIENGFLKEVTLPSSQVIGYTYSPAELLSSTKNQWGGITQYTWYGKVLKRYRYHWEDSFEVHTQFVTQKISPDGATTTYSYSPSVTLGLYDITKVTRDGVETVYEFYGRSFSKSTGEAGENVCGNGEALPSLAGRLKRKTVGNYQEVYSWGAIPIKGIAPQYEVLGSTLYLSDSGHYGYPSCERSPKRPILQTLVTTVNGAQAAIQYLQHDENGNPREILENGTLQRRKYVTYYSNNTYNISGRVDDETTTGGDAISRTWDARGNLLTVTKNGATSTLTRLSSGDVSSIADARGYSAYYEQYKRGIPQREQRPDGGVISRTINDAGDITSVTDPSSRRTTFAYDAGGRLSKITPPAGNPTSFTYPVNQQVRTRGALSDVLIWNSSGQIEQHQRGGLSKVFRYNPRGWKTFESNLGSNVGDTFKYDSIGRLTQVIHSDGTTKNFNHYMRKSVQTDEAGRSVERHFDSFGDPNELYLKKIVYPASGATTVVYRNVRGQVTRIDQGGSTRRFNYNNAGFLVESIQPETGNVTYGRDALGNMTSKAVGSAAAVQYLYDSENRLTKVVHPDGRSDVLSYTPTGKILKAVNSVSTRTFAYDANDNAVSETLAIDGRSLAASYSYDGNDNLQAIRYPLNGITVSYSPDTLGRPTKALPFASLVEHWPSGRVARIALANGVIADYPQDSRERQVGVYASNSSAALVDLRYEYDGSSSLLRIDDAMIPARSRRFGYDDMNRLTISDGPWGAGSISYTSTGDIARLSLGGATTQYQYINNKLVSLSGALTAALTYDLFGNVTRKGVVDYGYDTTSNLICANCSSSSTRVDHEYDGLNLRISTKKQGVKTYEFRGIHGTLLFDYTPSRSQEAIEYIYAGPQRIAQRRAVNR